MIILFWSKTGYGDTDVIFNLCMSLNQHFILHNINLLNFFLVIFAKRVLRIYSVSFGLRRPKRIDRFIPILDRTFNWQGILGYDRSFFPMFMSFEYDFFFKKETTLLYGCRFIQILYCRPPSYRVCLPYFSFLFIYVI